MNWGLVMDRSFVVHGSLMVYRSRVMDWGLVVDGSLMVDRSLVMYHWSFMMNWGRVMHRCCVMHRSGMVNRSLVVHWGFMVDRSLVMNWSLMVYRRFVMNGRRMVHWRLFVKGFVARLVMSDLVMLSVRDGRMLSVVFSSRLFSSLVVSLHGLVLNHRDRHRMVIAVMTLLGAVVLCSDMLRDNWSHLMHSGLVVHWGSLMDDSGRLVYRWLDVVFLVSHEFLKEGLGHLDIFDMAARLVMSGDHGLVMIHWLLWNVMGRSVCRHLNVADLGLPVVVFGHLDVAWSGLNVVGSLDESWLLDVVRLLDISRLLDVARTSIEWLLLDIARLRSVHRLTVVCLVRCNVLVWHVDVAVLRGGRLLG